MIKRKSGVVFHRLYYFLVASLYFPFTPYDFSCYPSCLSHPFFPSASFFFSHSFPSAHYMIAFTMFQKDLFFLNNKKKKKRAHTKLNLGWLAGRFLLLFEIEIVQIPVKCKASFLFFSKKRLSELKKEVMSLGCKRNDCAVIDQLLTIANSQGIACR